MLGDSHAWLFVGVPGFVVLYVGAVTLHRLGRPGELLNQVKARSRPILRLPMLRIGPRDTLLVSAGEIDVRCHVSGQVEDGRDERNVIDDLAARLVARLSELRGEIGCRAGAVAVPPPVRAIEDGGDSAETDFPIRGAVADRVRWTEMLNARLADLLAREGHLFLPVPDGLTNADGTLRADRSDGTVHLDPALAELVASGVPLPGDQGPVH